MVFYLDGLYPGPLLRDHQAKVKALLPSAPPGTAGATARSPRSAAERESCNKVVSSI